MRRSVFFFLFWGLWLLCEQGAHAQAKTHSIDSLKVLLQQSRPDTNRANLLLELARSFILKPGEQASDLDTALLLVRQGYSVSRYLQYEKGEGNAYLIGAQAYRESGNTQQARRFGQTAIHRFTKNRHVAELAAAYMELGNTYGSYDEELKQRITYYERALPLFQQVGNQEREATTLRELADFYHILLNTTKAIELLKKSLAIYKQINYPNLQGVYDLLGVLYNTTGDFRMATKYGLLALKTAEQQNDTTLQLCTIYNRIGINYDDAHDHKQAIQYFLRSLAVARQYNDLPSIGLVGANLGTSYFKSGQYDLAIAFLLKLKKEYTAPDLYFNIRVNSLFLKIYQSKNQYKQAQYHYNQLIDQVAQFKKAYPGYLSIILVYPPLIDFLINTHQLEQVKPLLKEHVENAEQMENKSIIATSHLMQFRLDSAQGHYLTAINHFKTYKSLQDSLYSENKNKEIARLNVEFQTEKREQQLDLNRKNIQLLTSANLAQKSRNEIERNSMVGGAVLLTLLLGLTYNRYRLKQRTNQQLETKQRLIDQKNQSLQEVLSDKERLLEEREWMLREIHHRVKNNLQVISSMLNSQFDFLNDPTALAAIRESQNRVQVMALIHQKLYQSDNLAQINMREYIHEIVDYLIESFDRFNTIHPQVMSVDVQFDVALATPLGLIINEAVTNSLKYAFPQNRPGTVIVTLTSVEEQTYRLMISDDGVGLPAGFDVTRSNSLGLTMIRGLSKQIKGQLEITQENGVEISLLFSVAKKPVRTVLQTS
ncbi:histidine kinase dimerization/phosphoacceptor domain -containing protein [Larkinella sp. C7]|uniref:tetratricopeptide repeat-containing sensor histidine kinase n=1 Tax=Larkinella sp. C7 TaxID=2576607 RepID=UPI00111147EA|nr:histidine kinase dimerization/phosphoacceptor domain -containing protein [Larkinella sp. C7]